MSDRPLAVAAAPAEAVMGAAVRGPGRGGGVTSRAPGVAAELSLILRFLVGRWGHTEAARRAARGVLCALRDCLFTSRLRLSVGSYQ